MYPLHIAEGLGQEGLPVGQHLLDCRPSRALGWIPGHCAAGSVQDCWSDPQDTGWLGSSVPGGRVTALFLCGGWAGAGPVPTESGSTGSGVVSQLPPLGVGEEARPALRPVLGAPFSAFSPAENRMSGATRARAPLPAQKARAYRTQVSQPGRIAGPHVLLSPGLVASPMSPGPLLVVLAFCATGAPVLSGLFGF